MPKRAATAGKPPNSSSQEEDNPTGPRGRTPQPRRYDVPPELPRRPAASAAAPAAPAAQRPAATTTDRSGGARGAENDSFDSELDTQADEIDCSQPQDTGGVDTSSFDVIPVTRRSGEQARALLLTGGESTFICDKTAVSINAKNLSFVFICRSDLFCCAD